MSPEEFLKIFNVSRETISRLQIYHDLLLKWQKAINLVSSKTLIDIWQRHFADSAQLEKYISLNGKIADLGSGAGFPGLVLAILRPDLEVHLIEADLRKSEFLKNVSRETKTLVTIHNNRVEKILGEIGAPNFITARAFASLEEILELVPDNCKNADLLLLKGKMGLDEVAEAQKKYNFEAKHFPSMTDSEAHILKIKFSTLRNILPGNTNS